MKNKTIHFIQIDSMSNSTAIKLAKPLSSEALKCIKAILMAAKPGCKISYRIESVIWLTSENSV